jgi:hypothetical protein
MLPTAKSPPKADAARKFILIYGRPKIGKSTAASKIPDAIFIALDPGLDEILCFRVPADGVVRTWEELLGYVEEIIKSSQFKVIIIDTIDVAWQLCADAVCKKAGVEYYTEGALGFGKGRAMIQAEFQRLILRVKAAGLGLVLISHAQEREEETGAGTRSRWYPSLPRKAGDEITGLVDAILFLDIDAANDQRVIRLRSSSRYMAGCRGGATLPDKWPLDDYAGFMAAYTESLRKNAAMASTTKAPAPVTNGKAAPAAAERK